MTAVQMIFVKARAALRAYWRLSAVAIGVGVVMAIIFKVFEFIVNDGQDLIWNTIGHSDSTRWLVIPLAVGLSLLFGLLLVYRRAPRWLEPDTDLLSSPGDKKTTLRSIFWGLAIGGTSLLAGAPLGPEMPLTESSISMGKWAGGKLKANRAGRTILVATSVGALMVAFLGSLVMMALPFLLIIKQDKRLLKYAAAPIILGSLSAYGTLWLMDHKTEGYGSIPAAPHATFDDYWGAVVVALAVSVFAFLLLRLIDRLARLTKQMDTKLPWYSAAALFGLVLGILYLIGGQTVQFSGSAGTKMLVDGSTHYGGWALLGLALVKLVAIAWSKTAGYRGGLYFPSIYASVALALFVESEIHAFKGPGAVIGAVAAIFAALGFPDKRNVRLKDYAMPMTFAFLVILALIPFNLIFLALLAVLAAVGFNVVLSKYAPAKRA